MGESRSRRRFLHEAGLGVTAVALTQLGALRPAYAEDQFTIASTGGSYNEMIRASFIVGALKDRLGSAVAYSQQPESVAVSKSITQCGNPAFSVSAHADSDAILLAEGGCLQAYDLSKIPNYVDIIPTAKLPPRKGMDAFWASFQVVCFTLVWNEKLASKPESMKELWSAKYKGRVGVPAYGWYGMWWLHAVNKVFGGDEDNITPGMQAAAELVKKNNAVIIENVDQGMKAFAREEVVIAPFWNGRALTLRRDGVPVQIAYVPGSIQLGSGFVILRGTRFLDEAYAFVNNALDPALQIEMSRRTGYPPSNRLAKLPADMEHYRVPDVALKNMVALDYDKVNKRRQEYLDRWNKEVLG